MPDTPRPVFVYGTLTDPRQVGQVLADWRYVGPAVLEGLHRVEGRYPTLAPGGRTSGRLLVTTALDALDAYEGVGDELYVRVALPLVDDAAGAPDDGIDDADGTPADGTDTAPEDRPGVATPARAWLYVGDPDRLDAPADWPGEGGFAERVLQYVEEQAVLVRLATDAR